MTGRPMWTLPLTLLLAAGTLAGCTGATDAAPDRGGSAESGPGDASESPDDGAAADVAAPAAAYVTAVAEGDLDGLVDAFDPDGEVIDVTRRIAGHDAIRAWADREVIGGSLAVLEVTPTSDGQELLVHWAPAGSDGWQARYRFTFESDRIAVADLQYA
ncbi:nuclear transport factor 2 family protein [Actinoalloteichus sp. GBA129-24]|uniref:nuclear transport factor 2 family protein n=1 Tax=Actinoalloteichus sp. GBA129-24 TaxID=1612551 RepID=UPI000950A3FB|nr:nuclear transport factor 2 family protein [Actinoalloteichus sp. GBA129-24]APU19519.1 SnoaL-like domain [Actinoalloteichus sp. GBA129-24]